MARPKGYYIWAMLVVLSLLVSGCLALLEQISGRDLSEIQKSGKLRAITSYGVSTYFLYRGTPMGFEYELLTLLAKDLGVELELTLTRHSDSLPYMLFSKPADIIAANIAVTWERRRELSFTDHLFTTRQVLIQRRGDSRLRSPIDLIGQEVHVIGNRRYTNTLRNLSHEIGGPIQITEMSGDLIPEDLIRKVAENKIDYAVADETIAKVNANYYDNLDASLAVSFPQRIAWIVREQSNDFRTFVNNWIAKLKKQKKLQQLYTKYFERRGLIQHQKEKKYHSLMGKKISPYDDLIKEHARRLGWDWRLVAALIHQESRFDPKARSWAGARGLMQLMPSIARNLGVSNPYAPEQSIRGGTTFLAWLDKAWKEEIPQSRERKKFVLASYNAGKPHIEDAQRLARSQGKDPHTWQGHVAPYVLHLANPNYYNRPLVKHGYLRGEETYNYVRLILERYRHYQKLFPNL